MSVSAKQSSKSKDTMLASSYTWRSTSAKLVCFRRFARVLLSVVHLLQKRLCLLLIHEGEGSQTVLSLECMEEGPVLIVGPDVVYLLIPNHAAICRL